jgi:hypothetical protein
MNYDVPIFNVTGNSTNYDRYFKKIVRVIVPGEERPITGRLIEISDRFLTLEHLNGRCTLVKAADVSTMAELPERV